MSSSFDEMFKARGVEPKRKPTQTPKDEDTQPAKRKGKGKRSDPNYKQVTAYIPKDLHKRVKIELMDGDRDFSDLVAELLTNWLEDQ